MEFKVGDRVEAIKPPNGVEESQADQIGLGKLLSINPAGEYGETHEVQLDSGEEWWYSEDRLRPIVSKPTPTPSITQAEADRMRGDKIREELYGVKYAKSPSITVGTQVRLTGVVTTDRPDRDEDYCVTVDKAHKPFSKVYFKKSDLLSLEVIRQPFKRGEVVYWIKSGQDPVVVVEDETANKILVVAPEEGHSAVYVDASVYERRA